MEFVHPVFDLIQQLVRAEFLYLLLCLVLSLCKSQLGVVTLGKGIRLSRQSQWHGIDFNEFTELRGHVVDHLADFANLRDFLATTLGCKWLLRIIPLIRYDIFDDIVIIGLFSLSFVSKLCSRLSDVDERVFNLIFIQIFFCV